MFTRHRVVYLGALALFLCVIIVTFGLSVPSASACIDPQPMIVARAGHMARSVAPRSSSDDYCPWVFVPNIDLDLTLLIGGVSVIASSTVDLPTGTTLPVSIMVRAKPGSDADWSPDANAFDGTENSETYWKAFYLDFYKGTLFHDASFVSGEQMNASSTVLKSDSSVTFLEQGTYSAIIYDSQLLRDPSYCQEPGVTCYPSDYTIEEMRSAIASGQGAPLGSLPQFIGIVTFTVGKAGVSNVLLLPGIEGSRLYYGGIGERRQVWEPDLKTDIQYLEMNTDGTSKYELYTKDVINYSQAHNPLWGTIANIFGHNLEVYDGFEKYMDTLVASSTFGLKEWRAYPYDWRYDVRDIVTNGTPTQQADGSVNQVYVGDVLQEMASTSATGKVTIVAHSNGGLLAKALALSLGADASRYIDRIIMVGTPQQGTPTSIGTMLHGDDWTVANGVISSGGDVRTAVETMPSAYALLPTDGYFSAVGDPVVTFDAAGTLSGKYATSYGASLATSDALARFVENASGLNAQAGRADDLRTPLALSSALVSKAAATHAALAAWSPPPGLTVTTIAGWGQDTIKTYTYTTKQETYCNPLSAVASPSLCAPVYYLEHTPINTQDGDGTVVVPSAVGNVGEKYYFDSNLFRKNNNDKTIIHQDLTSATPIQTVIQELLTNKVPSTNDYIKTTIPTGSSNPITMRISSHSPVNLLVTDAQGNKSGVLPIPGTDFAGAVRDIPGSSVQVLDDEQYVNVPEGGTYSVVASGYASGSATLTVDMIGGEGIPVATQSFSNIPTSANSTATLTVVDGAPGAPAVDVNGDGITDLTALTIASSTDPVAYTRYAVAVINTMTFSRNEKKMLETRFSQIERLFLPNGLGNVREQGRQKVLAGRHLDTIARYVEQQLKLYTRTSNNSNLQRGISPEQAGIIIDMINYLKSIII